MKKSLVFMRRSLFTTKFLLALSSIFMLNGCSAALEQKNIEHVQKASQKREIISPQLLDILALTGVTHDGTLPGIVAASQKAWLRPAGKERWQMGEQFEALKEKILPLFEQMNLLQEVRPSAKVYDYALFNGSTVPNMRERLAVLFKLYNDGVRFKKLVVFLGDRPLDPEREPESIFFDRKNGVLPIREDWKEPAVLPKTETDMGHMLLDQAILPAGFKESVEIEFVDTPMQRNADGSLRRPNTGDTVNLWLTRNPKPGTALSISSQPHVHYQHAVLETLLPETFTLDTVGGAVKQPIHVGNFLDNLARWLYQEDKLEQKRAK